MMDVLGAVCTVTAEVWYVHAVQVVVCKPAVPGLQLSEGASNVLWQVGFFLMDPSGGGVPPSVVGSLSVPFSR